MAGGMPVKLAPTVKGLPDRMVIWPGGAIELVELKADNGELSPAQKVWHSRVNDLGRSVWVLRGRDQIDAWIKDQVERPANPPSGRVKPKKR